MRVALTNIEWETSARKIKAHELPGEMQIDVPDEVVGEAEDFEDHHDAYHWIEGRLREQFGFSPERFKIDRWESLAERPRWRV